MSILRTEKEITAERRKITKLAYKTNSYRLEQRKHGECKSYKPTIQEAKPEEQVEQESPAQE